MAILNVIKDIFLHKEKFGFDDNKIFYFTYRCNQDCIFCSNIRVIKKGRDPSIKKIKNEISKPHKLITIEGGEPTLLKDLADLVRSIKDIGTQDIILATNGVRLFQQSYAKELIDAGVGLFNINFPSHEEGLSERLTNAKGTFDKRVMGVKNLISLGAQAKTRLTFIINSLNFHTMPQYVEYVKKEFPGIFYIAFNMIKVRGYVKYRKYLVPMLKDIEPYLSKAMNISREMNIKIITDGIPLCYLKNFMDCSIDFHKKVIRGYYRVFQRCKPKECSICVLDSICGGPPLDYVRLYGAKDLRPISNFDECLIKNAKNNTKY